MTKPISPAEAQAKRAEGYGIPDYVYEAFNELIVANLRNGQAVFKQKEAVREILKRAEPKTTASALFDRGWLDVETAYRAQGWYVDYDKPAYNEDYEATFKFSTKPV